jgi:putative endonuclease
MTGKHIALGKRGESAAAAFLKKKGYRIVEKNFRTPAGEIDIIAEHEKAVVFIEVKTRSGINFGHPFAAVTPSKQKKISFIAQSFLAKHKITRRDCRFDVVSVIISEKQDAPPLIELLQDAFRV